MQIDFGKMDANEVPNFKNGAGITEAKVFFDGKVRILQASVKPNSSIGLHTHETNAEVMFFISGEGKVVCDGVEEVVGPGIAHYCPKGSSHTAINTGSEDLVMYCVVAEQ